MTSYTTGVGVLVDVCPTMAENELALKLLTSYVIDAGRPAHVFKVVISAGEYNRPPMSAASFHSNRKTPE